MTRGRIAIVAIAALALASGCALKPPGGYHTTATGTTIASSEDTVKSAVMTAARTVAADQLASYQLPATLMAVPVATNAIQKKLDRQKRTSTICGLAPLAGLAGVVSITEPRLMNVQDMNHYLALLYGAYYAIDVHKQYVDVGSRVMRGESRKRLVPKDVQRATLQMTDLVHGLHVQAEFVDDLRKLHRLTPELQRTLLQRILTTMAGAQYTMLDRTLLGFFYDHCLAAGGIQR